MEENRKRSHLHVFNGPVSDEDIHFLAMNDCTEAPRIMHVAATMATWRSVLPQLSEHVDPAVIACLEREGATLETYLRSGYGSVWVTPTRIRLKVPEEKDERKGESRSIRRRLFMKK